MECSLKYITGENPSSLGALLDGSKLKPGDDKRVEFNCQRLNNLECDSRTVKNKITENECCIHDKTGRMLLKDYLSINHNFNQNMLSLLHSFHDKIQKCLESCKALKAKYCRLFGDRVKTGRTVAGKINKAKSHNKRKAVKRNLKRIRENCDFILKNLCQQDGTCANYLNVANAKNIMDLIKTKSKYPTNNIDLSCVHIIGIKHAMSLFCCLKQILLLLMLSV